MKNAHRNIVPVVLIVVVVLQLLIPAVSVSHPILAALLMFLSVSCSLCVLVIRAFPTGKRLLSTFWSKTIIQIKGKCQRLRTFAPR